MFLRRKLERRLELCAAFQDLVIPILATGAETYLDKVNLYLFDVFPNIPFLSVFMVAFCSLGLVVHFADFEHTNQC